MRPKVRTPPGHVTADSGKPLRDSPPDPVTLQTATFVFTGTGETWAFSIGGLDPIDTLSGVFRRLQNFGYIGQDLPFDPSNLGLIRRLRPGHGVLPRAEQAPPDPARVRMGGARGTRGASLSSASERRSSRGPRTAARRARGDRGRAAREPRRCGRAPKHRARVTHESREAHRWLVWLVARATNGHSPRIPSRKC